MDIAKAFTLAFAPNTLDSLFKKALSRSLWPELIVPGKSEETKLENIFLASSEPTIALVNISIHTGKTDVQNVCVYIRNIAADN